MGTRIKTRSRNRIRSDSDDARPYMRRTDSENRAVAADGGSVSCWIRAWHLQSFTQFVWFNKNNTIESKWPKKDFDFLDFH